MSTLEQRWGQSEGDQADQATDLAAHHRRRTVAASPALWTVVWWSLAVGPTVTLLGYLPVADRPGRFQLLNDDAYYYLGVARSLASGHGSTFTGLTETNGYHPLWQLLLVPLAWATGDPDHLIVGVVVLQGIIWAAVVGQARALARLLGSEAAGLVAVAAMGVIAVVTVRVSFDGMETALLVLVLLVVVRLAVEAGDDPAPGVDRTAGVLLAVAFLTRLDAVFVTVPLAWVLLRRGHPDAVLRRRRLLALLGPTAVALVGYVGGNQLVFGTPTPVSGRAKGLGAPFLNTGALGDMLAAGNVLGRPAWLGAASFVVLAAAWAVRRRHRPPEHCDHPGLSEHPVGVRLLHLSLAIGVGQLLFAAYLTFGTSYPALPWYHYDTTLLLLCAGLLVADRCLAHARLRPWRSGLGLLAAGTFLVLQGAATFLTPHNTHTAGVAAAELVRSRLPSDAVLAMGDRAGIFGMVADRPLLQLEGLMADASFLQDLQRGDVIERMESEGVDYYVRYSPRRDRRLDGRDCWRFREPRVSEGPSVRVEVCQEDLVHRQLDGDQELTIWRFRPDRSSGR